MLQFNKKYSLEISFGIVLVLLGLASRTVLHAGPNFELVTAITLLAATRMSQARSWLIPMAIIVLSDVIIGNTSIFIFTWSGFAFTFGIGMLGKKYTQLHNVWKRFISYEVLGVISVLAFYFWTNFGVMLLGTMYAHSWSGYVQSLVMGLPFLRNQLQSALLFVPLLAFGYDLIQQASAHTLFQLKRTL